MTRETYKGRKLTARDGGHWGTVDVFCNGELVNFGTGRDPSALLAQTRAQIDAIDAEPIDGDRWGAWWYAPGTYEICPAGIHPQEISGQCRHFTCRRDRETAG